MPSWYLWAEREDEVFGRRACVGVYESIHPLALGGLWDLKLLLSSSFPPPPLGTYRLKAV